MRTITDRTPVTARPRSGYAQAALLQHVPQTLEQLCSDVDATLGSVGLAREDLADPGNLIPYRQVEDLLAECARRTACDHFALLACKSIRLQDFGLPGRVARCAPTVGEGLRALAACYNLRHGGGIAYLLESGASVRFVFAISALGTRDTHQYQLGALTIAFNMIEDLCGPDWVATEVRLAMRSPPSVRPYQRHFRAPVVFDADESSVVLSRGWLSKPLPAVDRAVREQVETEARLVREQALEDLPELVHDLIRKQISSGPCSMADVAAILGMHRRTLDRKLARHGESYLSLQTAVKREIALELLRETDLSIQQVADFLRYSSAANFATAFRGWLGMSPRDYRARPDQPPSAIVAATSTIPTQRNKRPESHGCAIVSLANR